MARNLTVRESEEWAEVVITYLEANGYPFNRNQKSLSRYLASCLTDLSGSSSTIYSDSLPDIVIKLAAHFSSLNLNNGNCDFTDALAILNRSLLGAADTGGGGGGDYVAGAVNFDGATTLWTRSFVGSPSSVGTFFHWLKAASTPSILSTIANFSDTGTQPAPHATLPKTDGYNPANFYVGSGGQPFYQFQQNGLTGFDNDLGVSEHADVETGDWQLVAYSWNVNAAAGSRTYQILRNGVLRTVVIDWEDGAAFQIDWSVADFVIGSDGWQNNGLVYSLSEPFIGDFSDLYLDVSRAVDLSDPAIVAKIISNGKPVDQGADGSLLTGSRPLIYLSGDSTTYMNNKGSAGNFAVEGTMTNATTSPSD
jgi:hypothetical protein